jgi:ABC-2 type transport system ATP-binding protein
MDSASAIRAYDLVRRFGERSAVDHVSFEVARGEVFGFLGPNGAGKSTTTRMLTGYLRPTSGTVEVGGVDAIKHPTAARRHTSVVSEEGNVYGDLSVWDNVMLMGELYGVRYRERHERACELLGRFDLTSHSGRSGRELSKGLRQRLMLCMALVSQPEVLFLDEPTSGLDVASARLIREIVLEVNQAHGTTVFLTTHNMEEAEQLCGRVAIIDHGRLVAIDSPAMLRARVHARRSVDVHFADYANAPADLLPELAGMEVMRLSDGFRVFAMEPGPLAQAIAVQAERRGIHIEGIATCAPTLEDVFVALTAKSAS